MSVPACSWNKQNLICLPLPFSYHILGALVLQLPLQKVLRWNNFFLNTRKLKYSRFCENFVQDLSPNYLLKQKNRFFFFSLWHSDENFVFSLPFWSMMKITSEFQNLKQNVDLVFCSAPFWTRFSHYWQQIFNFIIIQLLLVNWTLVLKSKVVENIVDTLQQGKSCEEKGWKWKNLAKIWPILH